MCAANERQRALQGMALEHGRQVVWQRVVDSGFYITVKAQHTLAMELLGAVLCIVLKRLGMPMRKGPLVLKVRYDGFYVGPMLATRFTFFAGVHGRNPLGLLGQLESAGFPTGHNGGVEQHHASNQ
jgi:hypothetical protein